MSGTHEELTMAAARATGNHRVTTEQRSQPMSEIRSRTSSQARGQSRLRSQSGAVRNGNGDETATESRVADAGIARQARDQLVSTIQQGQQVSIEAAQSWVETLSLLPLLPLRQMPKVPGFRAFPMGGVEAMTRFFFDVAADLLNAQREYTLAMVRLFASEEPV
jgi:hypothetical protein